MFASKSTRIASTWPCDFNHRRVVEVRSRYNGNDSEVHLGVCARVDLLAERSVCFRCAADETNRLGSGRQRPGGHSRCVPTQPDRVLRKTPSRLGSVLEAVSPDTATSGPFTLIKDHLAGGASLLHPNAAAALGTPGLAALLLPQILPVFSVVAPCHPGAALRDLVLVQRERTTSAPTVSGAAAPAPSRWSRHTAAVSGAAPRRAPGF